MEKLHSDVKLNILSRLPLESVIQCKLVSKPWRDLLHKNNVGLLFCIGVNTRYLGDVQFYYGDQYDDDDINNNTDDDEHHYYYSYKTLTKLNHPPFSPRSMFDVMLGSCNGLVCIVVPHHGINDPVYICNPVTGEYVDLPRLTCKTHATLMDHYMASGFGYHHSTNEYKVVRIYYKRNQPSLVGQVQVYTLGGGNGSGSGWRNKGNITYFLSSTSVLANGAIHWIDTNTRNIVSFDLVDEEFRLLIYPPDFEIPDTIKILRLRGHLCYVSIFKGKCVEIWAFKKKKNSYCFITKKRRRMIATRREQEYYYSWGWSKEFSIAWEGPVERTFYQPFALTKSNEVLLFYNKVLSCYDPKTASLKKLWDKEKCFRYFQVIPHMNSLVSLKALGEKSSYDKKITVNQ